ncbi:transcription factor TGA1 isoform X1 [Daucus carota subsp. sativus]|nr:PREDICTED: transcription factor TGA1-like isoform X1 [Daucus carota subsp. sativus]
MNSMASPSTQFATARRMGIYDTLHQISMWEDVLGGGVSPETCTSPNMKEDARLINKTEYTSQESLGPSSDNQAAKILSEKLQRRLAQNREAARKSRLRKKAYVQQLETSRLKLAQLEQDLDRTRQQGVYTGGALNMGNAGFSSTMNSDAGLITFGMEYELWLEEQEKMNCELKNMLQAHISDAQLRMFVESGLNHYADLFRMKADAARCNVFYLMSGMWRTTVERIFLWIGGFRPSEILKIIRPQLEPLTEQQLASVSSLRHSCQQAEDALSQGMEKLQQTLTQCVTDSSSGLSNYNCQMVTAMERLDSLESFMIQADHLRQQTLQQMFHILTVRQAARGLVAFGEYFQRLRAISSLWDARSHQHT